MATYRQQKMAQRVARKLKSADTKPLEKFYQAKLDAALSEAYILGVEHFRMATEFELGIGPVRMARVEKKFEEIVEGWENMTITKQ